jgi:hypothetical protein
MALYELHLMLHHFCLAAGIVVLNGLKEMCDKDKPLFSGLLFRVQQHLQVSSPVIHSPSS